MGDIFLHLGSNSPLGLASFLPFYHSMPNREIYLFNNNQISDDNDKQSLWTELKLQRKLHLIQHEGQIYDAIDINKVLHITHKTNIIKVISHDKLITLSIDLTYHELLQNAEWLAFIFNLRKGLSFKNPLIIFLLNNKYPLENFFNIVEAKMENSIYPTSDKPPPIEILQCISDVLCGKPVQENNKCFIYRGKDSGKIHFDIPEIETLRNPVAIDFINRISKSKYVELVPNLKVTAIVVYDNYNILKYILAFLANEAHETFISKYIERSERGLSQVSQIIKELLLIYGYDSKLGNRYLLERYVERLIKYHSNINAIMPFDRPGIIQLYTQFFNYLNPFVEEYNKQDKEEKIVFISYVLNQMKLEIN